ncbi:hypothetical protein BO94DRAFT_511208 [Aspergillus sclerotioniger CBS 115572]|uniref:DUF1772-domain-containing protein n=1 Tax=Aspergillus sclerotioniger CBS 115572 TaxID=1450535 RepID=A0A317X4Q7_9EURO|nr:hypothetical protein BO94DRAFT_511208 [Aspergillus sclerotioniger CBS 115572]PWY93556.1 hypothetical protein BO94DRAFT_511208 [Aspergillus sclerotioniger CBS 115572]
MASGLILDPHSLFRAAPLITSTCTLWFAFDQDFFLNIFLHPSHRPHSETLLPSYFGVFFRRGVVRVLGLLALTLTGGGWNIRMQPRQSPSWSWYVAGTAFAASHLLFVPAIAPKVHAIAEDKSRGESTRDLEGWLAVHRVRTWTVDLAAWGCFVVGMVVSREGGRGWGGDL